MRRALTAAAVFLGLAACGGKTPGVKVDPAIATLIPPDSTMLAGIRAEPLRKTPVYQKYLASKRLPGLDELAAKTGMDPRKDLWELLYVSGGKRNALLGRGNFQGEMETHLQRQGAQVFPYKMYHLVGSDQAAVVFFNSSTAAVGDTNSLRWVIDARGASQGPPEALAAIMRQIPEEVQIWAAESSAPRSPIPLTGNLANLNRLLGSIQTGSLYVDLRMGLNGAASGSCASEKDAQDIAGALKAMVGLGRLSTRSDQTELLKIFDSLRVTQESRQVKFYADIPEPLVEKLLSTLPGF